MFPVFRQCPGGGECIHTVALFPMRLEFAQGQIVSYGLSIPSSLHRAWYTVTSESEYCQDKWHDSESGCCPPGREWSLEAVLAPLCQDQVEVLL